MTIWLVVIIVLVVVVFVVLPIIRSVKSRDPIASLRRVNRGAAVISASARIIAKRTDTRNFLGQRVTHYFSTFELPDRRQLELEVSGPVAGQMVEGETGTLTWQGTYFVSFGFITSELISSTRTNRKANRRAPLSSSSARVLTKRADHSTVVSSYFANFELPDGQRMELQIDGPTDGQIIAGDIGTLSWQGSLFKGFQREQLR